jgi:hypothetical protein
MKKKKVYILAGLLLIAALLLLSIVTGSSPPEVQSQEVSLRAGTKDLSIDDMINSTDTRRRLSNEEQPTVLVLPGTSSVGSDTEDPQAIERIQQLIRENNEGIYSGLQEIENERRGIITHVDERDVVNVLNPVTPPTSSKPTQQPTPTLQDRLEQDRLEPVAEEETKDTEVEPDPAPEPKKRSPFHSVSLASRDNRNAIKAYVHSEQTVADGSTLKMRLGEDAYTDNGTLVPKNSPVFGTVTSVDGERVNVKITHINHQGNILPFAKLVYSKDALLGIYVPGNPKSDAVKDATGGALDGLPISGIPGVDAAAQIAGVVASSAAQAGKQALSKNVKKVKVTIKTNYEIYLRPNEKKH